MSMRTFSVRATAARAWPARRLVVLALALCGLALPPAAGAHAVLLGADPPIGGRVAAAPAEIVLRFNEPVALPERAVEVTDRAGRSVRAARPELTGGGATVRVALGELRSAGGDGIGVYTVDWRVIAEDGDPIAGSYQFAVGQGSPVAGVQTSAEARLPPAEPVLATWLLLGGLAVAAAGVWLSRSGIETALAARLVPVGCAVAAAGMVAAWLRLASELSDRAAPFGVLETFDTSVGIWTAGAVAAFSLAAVAAARKPRLALAPLMAGVVAAVAAGHAGTLEHPAIAVAVWTLHVLAAAGWVGALAAIALVVVRRDCHDAEVVDVAVRRYARLAAACLLVAAATGAFQYLQQVDGLALLTSTVYGRLLLAKTGILALVLMLALAARLVALPMLPQRGGLLRRVVRVELVALLAIVALGGAMAEAVPSRSEELARRSSAAAPPPPLGPALRLADLAGSLTVGLAVQTEGVVATVLGVDGSPLAGARVTIGGEGSERRAAACGDGCYLVPGPPPAGASSMHVTIEPPDGDAVETTLQTLWPLPADGAAVLQRAAQRLRAAPRVRVTERVTSDSSREGVATISELTGEQLIASLVYDPRAAVDARLVGTETVGGRSLRIVAWFVPGAYLWHQFWVDEQGTVWRARSITPAHRILLELSYPD